MEAEFDPLLVPALVHLRDFVPLRYAAILHFEPAHWAGVKRSRSWLFEPFGYG